MPLLPLTTLHYERGPDTQEGIRGGIVVSLTLTNRLISLDSAILIEARAIDDNFPHLSSGSLASRPSIHGCSSSTSPDFTTPDFSISWNVWGRNVNSRLGWFLWQRCFATFINRRLWSSHRGERVKNCGRQERIEALISEWHAYCTGTVGNTCPYESVKVLAIRNMKL